MSETISYVAKKNKFRKIMIGWSIAAAVIAALIAVFFTRETAALLLPSFTQAQLDEATSGVIAAVKTGLFVFALLTVPLFLCGRSLFLVSFNSAKEWKRQLRNSLICLLAFYAVAAAAVFLLPPFISDGLVKLDAAQELMRKRYFYRMNTIMGCALAVQLLLCGVFYGLRRLNNETLLKKLRTDIALTLGVTAIVLGFHLPLIMMIVLYLPAYACFEIGRLLGGLLCRAADKRKERIKAAESVIAAQRFTDSINVQGDVARPGEYALTPQDTVSSVLLKAGALPGRETSFVVIGGETGTMVDKLRFGQRPVSFEGEELSMRVYSVYDCPVDVTVRLMEQAYRRLGNIGSFGKVKNAFAAVAAGKSKLSSKQLVDMLREEMKNADTPSRKAALRLPESLTHCFPEVLEDHCDYHECAASVCAALYQDAVQNVCPVKLNMAELLSAKDRQSALRQARRENPLLLSACLACESKACMHAAAAGGREAFAEEDIYSLLRGAPAAADKPAAAKEKRVAVIGAGAGGLTAAALLRDRGYQVKLFEKNAAAGGSLDVLATMYPQYKAEIEKEKEALASVLDIEYGKELGKDVKMTELKQAYDAVLISIGASRRRQLFFPGEDLAVQAEDMLGAFDSYDFRGKRVFMAGCTNVAMLCAQRLLEAGAASLTLLPNAQNFDEAAWRGKLGEADLTVLPQKIRLAAAQRTEDGRFCLTLREGFAPSAPATDEVYDYFITAAEAYCDAPLLAQGGVSVGSQGVKTDRHSCASNVPGIFACGACAQGSSELTAVIADAIKAAKGIDAYLTPAATPDKKEK